MSVLRGPSLESPVAHAWVASVITSGAWCLPTKPGLCVNLRPQPLHLYLDTTPLLLERVPRSVQSVEVQNLHATQGSPISTFSRPSSASFLSLMTCWPRPGRAYTSCSADDRDTSIFIRPAQRPHRRRRGRPTGRTPNTCWNRYLGQCRPGPCPLRAHPAPTGLILSDVLPCVVRLANWQNIDLPTV